MTVHRLVLPLLLLASAQTLSCNAPSRVEPSQCLALRSDFAESAEGTTEAQSVAPTVRPFRRCFMEDTALSAQRPLKALLDRAADLYEQALRVLDASRGPGSVGSNDKPREKPRLPSHVEKLLQDSLLCNEEAARGEPRSVEAHHGRALALQEIGQLDEARDAITRALAIAPDDPETLAAAADLYINRLPPSLDHTETGLEFVRRGHGSDKVLIARLALLEGQALNDLGRHREALARLDASLRASDDVQTRFERAMALFDLCRFDDARRGFAEVIARAPRDAWAHHHLGLVLEFLGRQAEADRAFARARHDAPQNFREPQPIGPEEFRQIVDRELRALPPAQRADLADVRVETADLPDVADLTAEEPPLSPTILGLFRGTPLGAPAPATCDAAARTIVLYRRNLLRVTTTRDELAEQIRTTLLHELGHLHGEDDDALRDRGLE